MLHPPQLCYPQRHKVFICAHHLLVLHWHFSSRQFSNTAIMDKPYGRSKCSESQISLHQSGSACANTQVLAPGLCCISPKHSQPHSIPVHLTDRAFYYKNPKHNPYTSTGVASLTLCATQATKIHLHIPYGFSCYPREQWSAGRASCIVVAKPRNRSLGSSLQADEICCEWRLGLLRALFSLFICPLVFNKLFFEIVIFISIFAALHLML